MPHPVLVVLAVLMLLLPGCGAAAPPPAPFPRTAAVYLAQQDLPPIAELARYDLVVIDHEWARRAGAGWFAELRAAAPGIRILAYVNLVDRPARLGSAGSYPGRYQLWQFQEPTTSTFPDAWVARTAAGEAVSEWPETVMANLADTAPRVGGATYAEYAANWVADEVWSAGVWDGVFLDVWGDRVYAAAPAAWDVDRGGRDRPDSEIFGAAGPWDRGLTTAERIMRARMPGALLLANGDRTLRDGLLDGRAWESFSDPAGGRRPDADLAGYTATSGRTALAINARRAAPGSAADLRAARYALTAALLGDGYWAPAGSPDYDELLTYDELDGGGRGRGYLGIPAGGARRPDVPYADGLGLVGDRFYRRDFTAGVVLHNGSDRAQTVELGAGYRRLRGSQDPVTNDGAPAGTVTVPARDGLVLVLVRG